MATSETEVVRGIGSDYEVKYGFHVPEDYFFKSGKGLSHELVDAISEHKTEPEWMRKFRHSSLDYFLARPLPTWGGDVSGRFSSVASESRRMRAGALSDAFSTKASHSPSRQLE